MLAIGTRGRGQNIRTLPLWRDEPSLDAASRCHHRDAVKPDAPVDPGAARRVGQALNGQWHVDRLIDVGGCASVYEATHSDGRRAALKVLHASAAATPELRRRFLREGYVANKIEHPGALDILDDELASDGTPFLVMELLEGESLSQRLARVGVGSPMQRRSASPARSSTSSTRRTRTGSSTATSSRGTSF